MAKTSPEKLAAALRANLKRRKGAQQPAKTKKAPEAAPKPPEKPDFP
jgi:hypothetical protein